MDRAISRWILVFIAKQRGINCSVFKPLLSVLPLPDDDLLLKKLNLLCRIRFQIDDESSITEDMLHWLEVIEELDSLIGVASITASLVKAYCAVAVECTARYLPGKVDMNSQYFGALERIWRGRIRFMELAGADKRSQLLTDDLLVWRTCLEAALTDEIVRSVIMEMNVRTEAFRLLKGYLDEELEDLLPLLAVPAKNIPGQGNESGDRNISLNHCRENLKRHAPFEAARVLRRRLNRGARIADEDGLENGTSACTAAVTGKKETRQVTRLVKNLFPDAQVVAELPKSDKHNRISILDGDVNTAEVQERLQSSNSVRDPLPEPQKVTESLAPDKLKKSSNLEQDVNVAPQSGYVAEDPLPSANQVTKQPPSDQHVVLDHGMKNPLPDTHKESEMPATDQHNKISNLGKDVSATERSLMENNGASESSGVLDHGMKNPLPDAHKETEMRATDQHNKISNLGKDVSATERSLMENNAASESSVPEKSRNQPRGVRELPRYNFMNPNCTAHTYEWEEPEGLVGQDKVNPNKRPQEKSNPDTRPGVMRIRRFRRPWSSEEEETLRAGVQKFGQGQWKLILDCYSESFEGRTSTDLKDKWRNMNRYPPQKT